MFSVPQTGTTKTQTRKRPKPATDTTPDLKGAGKPRADTTLDHVRKAPWNKAQTKYDTWSCPKRRREGKAQTKYYTWSCPTKGVEKVSPRDTTPDLSRKTVKVTLCVTDALLSLAKNPQKINKKPCFRNPLRFPGEDRRPNKRNENTT